jgi:uncharacterized membrane protein YvbJ
MAIRLCEYYGHENDENSVVCENCGALRGEEDSYDNQDSEDLFLDDEYL